MPLPGLAAMNKWAAIAMATMDRARLGMTAPSDIVTLHALEIGRLPVTGRFSGQNIIQAMNERILDTAEIFKLLLDSCYSVSSSF